MDSIPPLPHPVTKIAIVRALHLGDLILTVPALRALRARFPQAEITLIGLPWAQDFVRRFSKYIDRLSEFPGYPGITEVPVYPERTEQYLREAQKYGYDIAIQMHGDGTASNPFTVQLGARYTVGYQRAEQKDIKLSLSLPYNENDHTILKNLRLVEALGALSQGTHLEFPLLDDDYRDLRSIPEALALEEPGFWIGLHPGARPPSRRWPPDRFAMLADALAQRYNARIVILGGPGEEALAAAIQERMKVPAVALAGRTTIGALAVAISRLGLFISNDSGPAHIATALDIPSVAIFSSADPRRWAPLDQRRHRIVYKPVGCNPCPHWECPIDHRCVRRVYVEDVLAQVEGLLRDIWRED